ncbi:predicted oxidoreductase, aryl-alcohol dehydrogenase like protein [Sanguibacter keddieii DSM 10542]|uniref:Predicted oxidoreductase, aryl-alcohol dehydrogenase like protein n=1 Tax=Sanguibacter keddieii (strain ATCC 51767 / DSM 10542 / NCFB 3025 / ST-74) TaxID=446469 RepID=D1BJ22_SANKS|nr:aldo/keto reductase [Sanguibacter keddieii]ACZ22216.1 predicted oxidoreductase, aryl-alcohol dehydrogenase like protein [Sanguibacter keddieii DSM 10542]
MRSPADDRHAPLPCRRVGRSGLSVSALSLGLWQNFGDGTPAADQRGLVLHALDAGVVHFDLANNYGPPPGSAETGFGRILRTDLARHRHELSISTKAGYRQWPGPRGEGGSRGYLLASLDQSLRRLGVDEVDIFYSHRFDPTTPLEETIGALATAVSSGRALYAGISSYSATRTQEALTVAASMGLPLTVHQPSYSLLNRWIEEPDASGRSLLDVAGESGTGLVTFSPLAQGLLTDRYRDGVPESSRAARGTSFQREYLSEANLASVDRLRTVAQQRGQTLAQMALAWCLRDDRVSAVLVGARTTQQLDENLAALDAPGFTADELASIDEAAVDGDLNLWASRSSAL